MLLCLAPSCAARYSVPSERLAGRDLTKPIQLRVDGETISTQVLSVETQRGVLPPAAIASLSAEPGERWVVETTREAVVGIGLGSSSGLLLGLVLGGGLLVVGCQGGGDGCVLLLPMGAVVGTLAGLGIGAAISSAAVEADVVWR
jgi:hypothetical protein